MEERTQQVGVAAEDRPDSEEMVMQARLRVASATDVGRGKTTQQDAIGSFIPAGRDEGDLYGYLMIVADGVSSGQGGDIASQTAVETIMMSYIGALDAQVEAGAPLDPVAALKNGVETANSRIYEMSTTHMGIATTVIATLVYGDLLISVSVGDSRAYLLRPSLITPTAAITPLSTDGDVGAPLSVPSALANKALAQLNRDHSWLEEVGRGLVERGIMTRAELQTDKRRHQITRALGLRPTTPVDLRIYRPAVGDVLLICTDGLWNVFEREKLAVLVAEAARVFAKESDDDTLERGARDLLHAAVEAETDDNTSLYFAKIAELGRHITAPTGGEIAPIAFGGSPTTTESPASFQRTQEFRLPPQAARPRQMPIESAVLDKTEPMPAIRPTESYSPKIAPAGNPVNLDTVFARGQQMAAIGNSEDAIRTLITVEKLDPERDTLMPIFSKALVRHLTNVIERGRVDEAKAFYTWLSDTQGVTRYNEAVYDMAQAEMRRYEAERIFPKANQYAQFVLFVRPSDIAAKQAAELSDMYITFQRRDLPIEQKVALGQSIYARDPEYGVIEDDLALLYMQQGDTAAKEGDRTAALAHYNNVLHMRVRDPRLRHLASGKIRALEDASVRDATQADKLRERMDNMPLSAGRKTLTAAELEQISQLKERVSRAQKAWDNGRREIGAEYIHLVEELNAMLSPNPWQPTYPRVCYEYGRWLYEQRQYTESRPYFQRAADLGITAAQQRLNDIDRRERDGYQTRAFDVDAPVSQRSTNSTTQPGLRSSRLTANTEPLVAAQPTNSAEMTSLHDQGVPPGLEDVAPKIVSQSLANGNLYGAGDPNRYSKPERFVGTTGGATRPRANANVGIDPLQYAATRESDRIVNEGIPKEKDRGLMVKRESALAINLKYWGVPLIIFIAIVGMLIFGLNYYVLNPQTPAAAVATSTVAPNIVASTPSETAAATPSSSPTTAPTSAPSANLVTARVAVKVNGADPAALSLSLEPAQAGGSLAPLALLADSGGVFRAQSGAKIDPATKYQLVARPKDSQDRKYKATLAADDPLRPVFVKDALSIGAGGGLDATFDLPKQALAFYPLDSGTNSHSLRGSFQTFYEGLGIDSAGAKLGLRILGLPISEDFTLDGVGRVQFFERGILKADSDSPRAVISYYKLGAEYFKAAQTCSATKPPLPATTDKAQADATFRDFATRNAEWLGSALGAAFDGKTGDGQTVKMQYFEGGRLEAGKTADGKPFTNIGRMAAEYATCKGWTRS